MLFRHNKINNTFILCIVDQCIFSGIHVNMCQCCIRELFPQFKHHVLELPVELLSYLILRLDAPILIQITRL